MKKTSKIKQGISDIRTIFHNSMKYLFRNFPYVLLICAVCFTLVQLATAGFLKCLFLLAETIDGKGYIAANNLTEYLKSPLVILIAVIYIIFLCNVLFFQIGIFVYIFEKSEDGKKASLSELLRFGFYSVRKLAHPKNWIIYLFVLLILPFSDVLNFTYFKISLVVPGFILDFIETKWYLAYPYYLFTFLLMIFSATSIYSFHYFLFEDISFIKAYVKSLQAFVKHIWTNLFFGIFMYLAVIVSVYVLSTIIIVIIGLCGAKFASDLWLCLCFIADLAGSIVLVISLPVIFAALTALYHFSCEEDKDVSEICKLSFSKAGFIVRIVVLSAFLLGFAAADIGLNVNYYDVYGKTSSAPIVIAHRGASKAAPENSLPAFQAAIDQGADMIELDIHETKDGVLVVSHDSSLKNIAGINENVYDLTYEEISKLDVGSWFSEKYKGLKIATLDEALELCKDKVQVIIEIKPTDHDDHLEEKLIDTVYKYDMKNDVIIHSLQTDPLLRVKELDPTMKVAYCMVLAIGDIQNLEWSDLYTVEESNISYDLVKKVHEAGKQIYAWTINNSYTVQHLIDCGVDGFIGDDPVTLKEDIAYSEYDSGLIKFLRMFSLQQLVM